MMEHKKTTDDPIKCILQLYEFMELGTPNIVRSKTGRHQTLNMGTLNNLQSNAAMCHSASRKSPAPLPVTVDLRVKLSKPQKAQLANVYATYCHYGEKSNYQFMGRTQWLKFVRHAGLVVEGCDVTELDLLFDKVNVYSEDQYPEKRFTLTKWLEALVVLASKRYEELDLQAAFNKLVEEQVVPSITALTSTSAAPITTTTQRMLQLGPSAVPPRTPLTYEQQLSEVLQRDELAAAVSQQSAALEPVFHHYTASQEFSCREDADALEQFKASQIAKTKLHLDGFVRLAHDFHLIPDLLTKTQLTQCFRQAKLGPGGRPTAGDPSRLTFQEFQTCLARCALLAFGWQPPPPASHDMTFSDAYQTSAKQLWLQEAQEDQLRMWPDEVVLPAADYFTWRSTEDQPHPEDSRVSSSSGEGSEQHQGRDWEPPSSSGRAPSRAYSMIQKKSLNRWDGGEAMTIHGGLDKTASHEGKPLHLSHFTVDWIARPRLPLGETNRLRPPSGDPLLSQGLYHQEAGLPPVFHENMEKMVTSRVIREQHLELLHMNYQAAQRQVTRERRQAAAAKRQALQEAAGQLQVADNLASTRRSQSMPGGHNSPPASRNAPLLQQLQSALDQVSLPPSRTPYSSKPGTAPTMHVFNLS